MRSWLSVFVVAVCLALLFNQQTHAAPSPVTINVGCLYANRNVSYFEFPIRSAIEYMTSFSYTPLENVTQADALRNQTAASFFPAGSVVFNLTCIETRFGDSAVYAQQLYQELGVVAILGDSTSARAISASNAATVAKRPIISYAATSTALSNKSDHPYFLRTIPADRTQAKFITDFLVQFQQEKIATIASGDSYGTFGVEEIAINAQFKGIQVNSQSTVTDTTTINTELDKLKAGNATVFVVFLSTTALLEQLLIAANQKGMLAAPYVWVFSESLGNLVKVVNTNDVEVTSQALIAQNLQGVLDKLLYVRLIDSVWSQSKYFTEQNAHNPTPTSLDAFAFDAMIALGYAAKNMIAMNKNMLNGDLLLEELKRTNFIGATGRIRFDDVGDRVGSRYAIENIVGTKLNRIASFTVENGQQLQRNNFTAPGSRLITASTSKQDASTVGVNQWKPILNVPPPRYLPCFALHRTDGDIYLFGGYDLINVHADLWKYSLQSELFSPVYPISLQKPVGRYDAGYTFVGDFFVVYGGFDGNRYLDDVWRYNVNNNVWEQIPIAINVPNPGPRSGARLTTFNSEAYLFGGYTSTQCASDIWRLSFTGQVWTPLNTPLVGDTNAPSPRRNGCFLTLKNFLVVWGGKECSGDQLNDLWTFTPSTGQWTKFAQVGTPVERYDFRCELVDNTLFVSGGWSDANGGVSLNDMYSAVLDQNALDTKTVTWTLVTADIPNHTPRDSAPAVAVENSLVWFGGWPSGKAPSNDLWKYDVVAKSYNQMIPTTNQVEGITSACYASIGNLIYVFGGKTSSRDEQNLLYSYNIDTAQWQLISSDSDAIPSARTHCSLVSAGGNLYLFGGKTSAGQFLADHWLFTPTLNSWIRFDRTDGSAPSARAHHSAHVYNSESSIIVYGGRNTLQQFNEIWQFDLDHRTWTHIDAKNPDAAPSGTVDSRTAILPASNTMLVYGAVNLSDEPTADIYEFSFTAKRWDIFAAQAANVNSRTRATIAAVSSNGIILYGGNYFLDVYNDMYYVTKAGGWKKIDTTIAYEQPLARSSHSMTFVANKLVMLHGTGSFPGSSTISNSIILPDVWEYQLGPVCSKGVVMDTRLLTSNAGIQQCINCTVGTREYKGKCVFCDVGTYNDAPGATACRPCSKGYFNAVSGATSSKFCIPCPAGSYNDVEGAGSCKPCPPMTTCPIGSVSPRGFDYTAVAEPNVSQPLSLESNSSWVFTVTIICYVVAIGVAVVIGIALVLTATLADKFGRFLAYLDLFYTLKHTFDWGPVYMKQTRFGGVFSMITFLFVAAVIVSSIYSYATDNVYERRSLIPNLSIGPVNKQISAEFLYTLDTTGYIDTCEGDSSVTTMYTDSVSGISYDSSCSSAISLQFSGIKLMNSTDTLPFPSTFPESVKRGAPPKLTRPRLQCKLTNQGNDTQAKSIDRQCKITVKCQGCGVDSGTSKLIIRFNDQSYVTKYSFQLATSTGVIMLGDPQVSTVSTDIRPDPNKLFRGTTNPTVASLRLVQTIYNRTTHGDSFSGYHADYKQAVQGDQVSIFDFNQRTGVAFSFEVEKDGVTFEVVHANKKEISGLITELLGSIVGVLSAVGGVMYWIEWIYEDIFLKTIITKIKKSREGKGGAEEAPKDPKETAPQPAPAPQELADVGKPAEQL